MNIRAARLSDAAGVACVLHACYNIADDAEGAKVFRSETRKAIHYLVAEEGGAILGLTTWLVHGLPKHQLAELDRIAVLPEWRGKDVARRLFDALVQDAQAFYRRHGFSLRKLFLLTHDDNARAHAFYEKMGFKRETTLKDHYYKGKDEQVYSMFFD